MERKIIIQKNEESKEDNVMLLSPRIAPIGDRFESLSHYTIVVLSPDGSPLCEHEFALFSQFSSICQRLRKRGVKFYAYIDKSIREYFNVDFV